MSGKTGEGKGCRIYMRSRKNLRGLGIWKKMSGGSVTGLKDGERGTMCGIPHAGAWGNKGEREGILGLYWYISNDPSSSPPSIVLMGNLVTFDNVIFAWKFSKVDHQCFLCAIIYSRI